ncbi:MAG: hypothetical protein ACRDJN_07705, partial [Chloroflexota bacterium]
MCGIMAYVGAQEALPIVLGGLRRLEYRGYDSAGVAVLVGGNPPQSSVLSPQHSVVVRRAPGKLDRLVQVLASDRNGGG